VAFTTYSTPAPDCRGADRRRPTASSRSTIACSHAQRTVEGAVLNHAAAFSGSKPAHIVPNHVLAVGARPNVLVAKKCTPLPVAMVVRRYPRDDLDEYLGFITARPAREFWPARDQPA